jgi:response regulator RpfG family c-di-GMP phosphodiesterase
MSQAGPIILVDDDADDEEIVREVLGEIGVKNELIHFDKCSKAFQYLKTSTDNPFIILSDINIPAQSGIEFKRQIDDDPHLRAKSIPFVFLSTVVDKRAVDIAYKEMTVQGFFKKANSYDELKIILKLIMDYWKLCRHPNA